MGEFIKQDSMPSYAANETIVKRRGVKEYVDATLGVFKIDQIDTAGELGMGIAQDGGVAGVGITVAEEGIVYAEAGGAFDPGDYLQFSSAGKLVKQTTGRAVARAIQDATADTQVRLVRFLGHVADSLLPIGADLASVAGVITPTARKQHVTGTLAITGITATGFGDGDQWVVIPDGAFTWTTATNIGVAGTAVAGQTLVFTYDLGLTKWYPSYV